MEVSPLAIKDVLLVTPRRIGDHRGFFSETFNKARFAELGIVGEFVQDNHSLSAETGTIRGFHFQSEPHAQDKLVRVSRGAVLDVVVDVRRGSPTYGQHVSAVLSAENWAQLWVPKGFAHGICTLEPDTEVLYKVTAYYSAESDKGLAFDDPALGVAWPVPADRAILSDKDRKHPRLADLPAYFVYRNDGGQGRA
ncbi:MAG: dTDP-4-dehydrorhamnose 3,5-epimerase [Parvibaculaceae bacterium]